MAATSSRLKASVSGWCFGGASTAGHSQHSSHILHLDWPPTGDGGGDLRPSRGDKKKSRIRRHFRHDRCIHKLVDEFVPYCCWLSNLSQWNEFFYRLPSLEKTTKFCFWSKEDDQIRGHERDDLGHNSEKIQTTNYWISRVLNCLKMSTSAIFNPIIWHTHWKCKRFSIRSSEQKI